MITVECPICDYAEAHGWWGPTMRGKTHCSTCHATWGGTSRAHCKLCHETFASYGVSDHHWRPPAKRKPAEHVHPSLVEGYWADEGGFWHYGPRRDAESLLSATERVQTGDLEDAE